MEKNYVIKYAIINNENQIWSEAAGAIMFMPLGEYLPDEAIKFASFEEVIKGLSGILKENPDIFLKVVKIDNQTWNVTYLFEEGWETKSFEDFHKVHKFVDNCVAVGIIEIRINLDITKWKMRNE